MGGIAARGEVQELFLAEATPAPGCSEAAEREEDRGLLSRAVSAVRGWFGGEDGDEPAEEADPPETDGLSQPPSGVDREGRLRYYLGADPVPRAGAEPGSVDGGAT